MTRLATVINKIIDIINTKQPTLVSGENIKKLNGTDIVGSGNIPVKTVGGESILGDGNVGVKTINGETMIGSGDAEIVGTGTLSTTAQNIIGAINELDTDKAEQSDLTALTGRVGTAETDIVALDGRVTQAEAAVGTPLVASTVAGMTDQTKIYVYTGSETGYTSGNWYYWNGTAWTSGGVYNSTAFETDTTLSVAGMAADAKATGDELTDVKSDLVLSNIKNRQTLKLYGAFQLGSLYNGVFNPDMTFRVATDTIMSFDEDIFLDIASGYKIGVHSFVNNVFSSDSGWKTGSYVIPQNTQFKVVIAKNPEDQLVTANINEFIDAVTILTKTGVILENTILIDKSMMVSGALQTASFLVSPAISWVTYLHKIPVEPTSHIKVDVPLAVGVDHYGYRFGWYDSNGSLIDQIANTTINEQTIPSTAYYFAFGVYALDSSENIMLDYNLFDNLPSNNGIIVKTGSLSNSVLSIDNIENWAYNTFAKKEKELEEAGYSIGCEMLKQTVYYEQKTGTLLYNQGFCFYDDKIYSVKEGKLGVQDSSFNTIASVDVNIGHGNNIQLGNSNLAYVNGTTDHKVYIINLDTYEVVDSISLPFNTGYDSAVIDDINNMAYILHTESSGYGVDSVFTLTAYDLTNTEVLYTKKVPFTIRTFQATDFYNGNIILLAGDNTNTDNYIYTIDLNGTALAETKLNIFASDEPEGVFVDRSTKELYVSSYNQHLYALLTK